MIRRQTILLIALLIVGCKDSGKNCMKELQVETCVELEELYEIATNDYLSSTEEIEILRKKEIMDNIKSCKEHSCKGILDGIGLLTRGKEVVFKELF